MEINYELLSLSEIKHSDKRKQERRSKYCTCYTEHAAKSSVTEKQQQKYHPPKHPKQNPLLHKYPL